MYVSTHMKSVGVTTKLIIIAIVGLLVAVLMLALMPRNASAQLVDTTRVIDSIKKEVSGIPVVVVVEEGDDEDENTVADSSKKEREARAEEAVVKDKEEKKMPLKKDNSSDQMDNADRESRDAVAPKEKETGSLFRNFLNILHFTDDRNATSTAGAANTATTTSAVTAKGGGQNPTPTYASVKTPSYGDVYARSQLSSTLTKILQGIAFAAGIIGFLLYNNFPSKFAGGVSAVFADRRRRAKL